MDLQLDPTLNISPLGLGFIGSARELFVIADDQRHSLAEWGPLLGRHQATVVHLNGRDGLNELLNRLGTLAPQGGFEAVHIIGHGSPGSLQLGRDQITGLNLDSFAEGLHQLGSLMAPDGDLLLYGCEIAAGDSGSALVQRLAQYTGSDVAASTTTTGTPRAFAASDWTLELQHGDINLDRGAWLSGLGWDGTLSVPILASVAKVLGEAVVGAFAGYAVEQLLTTDDATKTSSTNVVLQFPQGDLASAPPPVKTGIEPGIFVKSALYLDSNGDLVDIRLTGNGTFKIELSGSLTNMADALSIELSGTDANTGLSISVAPIGQAINAGSATSINKQTEEINISGLYNRLYSPGYTTLDRLYSTGTGKIGNIELTAAIVNNIELDDFDINSIELDVGYTPLVDRVNTSTLSSSSGITTQLTGNTISNNTAYDGEIIDFAIIDDDPTFQGSGTGTAYRPVTGLIDLGNLSAKSLERLVINGSIGASTGDPNDRSPTNDIRGVVNIAGRLGNIAAKRSRLDGSVIAGSIGKIDIGRIDGNVTTTEIGKPLTLTLPGHYSGFVNSAGHLNMAYTFNTVIGDPDVDNINGPILGRITAGGGISGITTSETDPIFVPSGYQGVIENTSNTKGIADIRVNGALTSRWVSESNIGNISANTIGTQAVIEARGNIGNVQALRRVVVPKQVVDPGAPPVVVDLDGTFIAGGSIGNIQSATGIGADFRAETGSIGTITALSEGIHSTLIEAKHNIGLISAKNQLINSTKIVAQEGSLAGLKVFSGTWSGVMRAGQNIGDIYVEKGNLHQLSLDAKGSVGNITVKGSNTIVGGTFTAGTSMGKVTASAARGTAILGALFQAGDENGQYRDSLGVMQTSSIAGVEAIAHGATLLPSVDAGMPNPPSEKPSQPPEVAAHGLDSVQILAGSLGPISARAYTGSGIVGVPFKFVPPDADPNELIDAGYSVIHAKVANIAKISGIGNGHGIVNLIAVAEGSIGNAQDLAAIIGLSEMKGNGIEHSIINANSGTIKLIEGRGGVAGGHGINDTYVQATGEITGFKGTANANEGDAIRKLDARAGIFGTIEATVLGGKGGDPNQSRGSGIVQSNFKAYNDTKAAVISYADNPDTEIPNPYVNRNAINIIKADVRSIYGKGIDESIFDLKGGIGLINSRTFANSAIFKSEFSAFYGDIKEVVAEATASGTAIDGSLIVAENGSIGNGKLGITAKTGGVSALDHGINGSTFQADDNISLIQANSKGGAAIVGSSFLADHDLDNIGVINNIVATTTGENFQASAAINGSTFIAAKINRIEANVDNFEGGSAIADSSFTGRTATYDTISGAINNKGTIGLIQVSNASRTGDGITNSKFHAGAAGSIGNINVDVTWKKLTQSEEYNRVASGRAIHLSEFRASILDPDQVALTGTIGAINIKAGRVTPALVPAVVLPPNRIPPNDQATLEASGLNASYFAAYGGIGQITVATIGTGVFGTAVIANLDPLNGAAGILATSVAQQRGPGRITGINVAAKGTNATGTLMSLFAGSGMGTVQVAGNGFPIPNVDAWLRQQGNLTRLATALAAAPISPIMPAQGLLDFMSQPVPISSSPVTLTGFMAIRENIGAITFTNTARYGNYPFLGSLVYAKGTYGPVTSKPMAIKAPGDALAEGYLAALGYESPNVFSVYPLPTTFIGKRSAGGNLPAPVVV